MQLLTFTTHIHAPAEKVWETLWNDTTYRHWTAVFHEGSHAVSDWKEGSKIHFLSPDGKGMSSVIDRLEPNRLMVFKHLGMVDNFEEQPSSAETKTWEGSKEVYKLSEAGGVTTLITELDADNSFADYFKAVFPKALETVKQLAEGKEKPMITVLTEVAMPPAKAWECFTNPVHVTQWYHASDDWHAPRAENDLRTGGKFLTRMEAKDGSFGFDFEGTYTEVTPTAVIKYVMADGRQAHIYFTEEKGVTKVVERFHPEDENSHELQRNGWQTILSNFAAYASAQL